MTNVVACGQLRAGRPPGGHHGAMASINVSVPDMLTAVRGLDGAGHFAQQIARRSGLGRGALDGCGHLRLARAGDEMLSAWERGISDLVEGATDLSSLLRDAARVYGYTEQVVITSVRSAQGAPAR